jgi:hypothetical protein
MSRVRLRVNLCVTSTGCGADDIENTTSAIVVRRTVFTELMPGNALIKFVTILSNLPTPYIRELPSTSHSQDFASGSYPEPYESSP